MLGFALLRLAPHPPPTVRLHTPPMNVILRTRSQRALGCR
ncbi:Uncharacterised protein [Vibrio cholerae]|nr:Uncharacterised protein [Vibrio cholerae]